MVRNYTADEEEQARMDAEKWYRGKMANHR